MADTGWTLGFPIAFTAQGDLTAEAMYKHIQELRKVYGHLNYLRANTEGGASLSITGFVPTPEDLPTSGVPVNSVYLTNGDTYDLWVWDGTTWNKLNVNALPVATESTPGLVQLGTLGGISSDIPSPTAVITEEIMANLQLGGGGGGVPSGTIVMWYGAYTNIPPGWAYCDGTSGTPDLRDKFVKCTPNINTNGGATGGLSTVALTVDNLPGHAHGVDIASSARIQTQHHTHNFQANVSGGGGSHYHSFSGSGNTNNTGGHTHTRNDGWQYALVKSGAGATAMQPQAGSGYFAINVNPSSNFTYSAGGGASAGSHSHSVTISGNTGSASAGGGGSVSGTTSGNGAFDQTAKVQVTGNTANVGKFTPFDNKPPFMELMYLMKL
jgi:hypothetical protein